jgi:hypothetical protein
MFIRDAVLWLTLVIQTIQEGEIEKIQARLDKKFSRLHLNKLGVVDHAYNPK